MAKRTAAASRSAVRPPQSARTGGGIGLWVRQRRTRSHLSYLPKWTARRPEPFGVQGLHWLPAPTGSRDPALFLHGGAGTVLAVAEMSPGVLRGPDAGDLGARLGTLLEQAVGAGIPLARLQVLTQVPGSAGRTRSFVVVGLAYTPELVAQAARFAQGERGLTAVCARPAVEVFTQLASDGTSGARLGPLVPLDRTAVTGLFGSLILPGRGTLGPRPGSDAWQPTEVDARAPRWVSMTGPVGPAAQTSTWWHATGWVKRWPRGVRAMDLAASASFLSPGVSGATSLVVGMTGPPGDRAPAVTGYVTVSGHDAGEVELARITAHAAAEERDGFVEFCDRRHHLAFAHTLPLATGLRG
ncbi:MAG TPA: hypothetical protein VFU73_14310 [Actinocrinis sp.]|nr:hypothetical protein [Actinocrinis sp.]